MQTLTHTLDSLWQVVLVGLLLGAGLPAIFALGIKALATGETDGDGTAVARPAVATAAGVLCFAAVVIAIIAGILFIMKDFLDSTFGISVF